MKEHAEIQKFQHTRGTVIRTSADNGIKERLFDYEIPKLLSGYEGWIMTARQKRQIGSTDKRFLDSYAKILSTGVMKVY